VRVKKRRPTKVIDQLDREIVLTSAARLFKIQGYERTTVKEIADACNMLPGSLHYRYKTKEAILIDLMRLGLEQVSVELIKACVGESNPAEQLRKGINAHLKVLVTGSDMVYVLLFEWRALQGDARKEMIQLRDRYEALWAGLLKPLAQKGIIHKDVDLDLLRLIGLGALNWVATWFTEEGRYTLEDIGNFVWRIIKQAVVVPGETDI
jgi:TetR/AcrR family transcriptional regulator, cholesterol catabolism regulator